MDPSEKERHRIEGFLPADDFLAQLQMGRAQVAFSAQKFDESEKLFRGVVDQWPDGDSAAEALYWAGVSKYKGTNDPNALGATAAAFKERYQTSPWAKKASVWG